MWTPLTSAHHHMMHLLATYLTIAVLLLNALAYYTPHSGGHHGNTNDQQDAGMVTAQSSTILKNLLYRLDLVDCPNARFPASPR